MMFKWNRFTSTGGWRTCLLLTLFAISGLAANAQGVIARDTSGFGPLLQQGRFDEVISQATRMLQQFGQDDPELHYLRGYAERRIAWFGAAEADLTPIAEYQPGPKWPKASELVQQIEQLRALCPPHTQEVRADGQVAFRVYFDEDTPWTQAIIALLPEGLRIGQELFGVKAYESAVFIFANRERMDAFTAVLHPQQTANTWAWAKGNSGLLYFSRVDGKGGKPAEDIKGDYFRGTVVHEYTHSLLHRALGTRHIPLWLDEGMAMYAATRLAPHDLERNDKEIARCVTDKAFLSLDDATDITTFYAAAEKRYAKRAEGEPAYDGPDAYAQGLSMVRFLVKHSTPRDFVRFVNLYAVSGEKENAFQTAFGASMADFYAAWLQNTNKSSTPKPE